MAAEKKINIEVVYATPRSQHIIRLTCEDTITIQAAIDRSEICLVCPEIDLTKHAVGIFGQEKKLTDCLQEGDRIEIYRPLIMDPKEARKKRAKNPLIKRP